MPLLETKGSATAQGYGFSVGASVPNYIEDVFSTYLETGNDGLQTINNGIDLANKGGMVWLKSRSVSNDNHITSTGLSAGAPLLVTNTTAAAAGSASAPFPLLSGFSSTGFQAITSTATYASWTFRKQPKFFDVVTWTGNSVAGRAIAHNLGSAPGCVIIKRTNTASDWGVWHRGNGGATDITGLTLNATSAAAYPNAGFSASFTSTTFKPGDVYTAGGANYFNQSGDTYVAYLFAHNAGGFGLSGTDNVISCGSFTGNAFVSLGYEPQWVLVKDATTADNWFLMDNMRGLLANGGTAILRADTSGAESSVLTSNCIAPTATGFQPGSALFSATSTYIYIAIRRGPMKTPTSGTSVYSAGTYNGTSSDRNQLLPNIPYLDLAIIRSTSDTDASPTVDPAIWVDRLRGWPQLRSDTTGAEFSDTSLQNPPLSLQSGIRLGSSGYVNRVLYNYVIWGLRRAPGFFDEVCYTGTGTTNNAAHNLQAVPELIIIKSRSLGSSTYGWAVTYGAPTSATSWNSAGSGLSTNLAAGLSNYNYGAGAWTSTTVNVSTLLGYSNDSGVTYVAYLFASCPGVSKVGSYTGTGTTQTINCGFTGGAKFVLVKASSTTGNWLVWDSARGIVAGNDPYLTLNSTAAEVTNIDWVDTAATGFELSSAGGNLANSSGVSYIFLAIA